ncbi:MAG TPA: homoserine dehydrogenase [Rudaea sp.]|nr:homoserine dehydrogenase [Rudaea sp.]
MPRTSEIGVALIGASGRVGRQVLALIAAHGAGSRLRLVAVAHSRTHRVAPGGLDPLAAAGHLEMSPNQVESLVPALAGLPRPLVIVDCTASADIAAQYPRWLGAGIDIVTPSKLASSGDRALAEAIVAARARSGTLLRDSASVGAQLPLLSTLRELHQAGDRVERFDAVLSGTLSFVLGRLERGDTLSAAVRDAVALGYAEPHPASDLSGEDVTRKLVILLRALGHDIELADVETVPLVAGARLLEADPQRLLAGLESLDELWRARVAVAQARRERWIYRASFDGTHARVAPERVPLDHPLAKLAPCENALILHSHYYSAAPLTIAGPGAGVELTAAAVFADLLDVAHRHVAAPLPELAAAAA